MQYLQQKTIKGAVYGVLPMSALDSMTLAADVGEIFGPTLATMAANKGAGIESDVFGLAVAGMFTRLRQKGIKDFVDRVMAHVEQNGKPIGQTWLIDFQGKLGTAVAVTTFAVGAQIGPLSDLLEGLGLPSSFMARILKTGQSPAPTSSII